MRVVLPTSPCGALEGRGTEVFVIGAGGHAKVVVAILQAANRLVGGIFDDDPARHGQAVLTVPVVGPVPEAVWWWASRGRLGLLAIGDNGARQRLARRLAGPRWATACHPSATIHPSAAIAEGVMVGAHAVVQPDAVVGAHAIVNTGAIVEHDCRIGAFCHIAPGAVLTGNVVVGEGALVGAGSVVVPNLTIGAWSTVGAGSVVTRPVAAHQVVAGVPGRPLAGAGAPPSPRPPHHQE